MKMRSHAVASVFGLLLAVVLLGSCERRSSTEPELAVVGSYTLRSVDGQPLPFRFTDTDLLRGDIIDGALTLNADRSYHWSIAVRWRLGTTPDTTQIFARSGTYQQDGSELHLTSDAGALSSATADGTRVVVQTELQDVPNGLTYLFVREGSE
jgi:hypothetical protein